MRADCLPHARVSVLVDGAAATEYVTETGDGKGALTFIEAVPGATFKVELELEAAFVNRNPSDLLTFCIYLDGEVVCSNLVYPNLRPITSTLDGALEQQQGKATLRGFVFAEHTTTDCGADRSLIHKLASLGEIRIELKRCRANGILQGDQVATFKGIGDDPLPEKATKGRAISNHAKLGQHVVVEPRQWVKVDYPYGWNPIATYIFQYRSRRDLEIEGILQRPPSPAPQVKLENRDPTDLTPDDARKQLRLLRAREAANTVKQEADRAKRERSVTSGRGNGNEENNEDGDDEVTITAEWDRRKRVKARAEGVEVIDLTED